ncbi:nucleolar complex protein 2 homolog [Nasonia vitripennis]|uniref:Nucleolar complex protein 2 homolog n=1 Tax=Nasonia vitripennis TaxID=7425 RepID=A0A7M7LM49_NASVI|nr:nucleolar complex protein 2 homolog [Nasonia vitripennis]XP_032454164.1 nucleolar complex protein 2 homolog [Nasonia vitripennis]
MKLKKGKAVEKMAKKRMAKKKKKSMAEISTDEFFNQDFENMDLSDAEDEELEQEKQPVEAAKTLKKSKKKTVKKREPKASTSKAAEDDSDSGESNLDPKEHKKALMNLQDTDPEFFKYLKENDKRLLDFNIDDDGDNMSEADEESKVHVPTIDELEIGSDESDYEAEGVEKSEHSGDQIKVTLKLIKTWQQEIQEDKTSKTMRSVVEAFHAALESINNSEYQTTQYKVEGGAVFNGIVQLCMLLLPDAFKRFLKLGDEPDFEAHKAKRFPKIKGLIKSYLSDLIKVFDNVSSPHIITPLLKHLNHLIPYTHSFSSLRKPLLRILLKFWSTAEDETVRVVAFLCIVKIVSNQNTALLNSVLKTMYIKYVENSKFVSPTTLPGINFMRRSLTEMYLIDEDCSYFHAFLYVRQLAIHLRNALTLKKKENFQMVYNWQYINSLWFWSELVPRAKKQSLLRQLIYPIVQITIGVIKLIPTAYYYPLRFHCVKMMINMSREANVFIPSLPFLVEILELYDFNKGNKAVSMKPISLMCMLRVSKSQAQAHGYKDAIIENVYELILESAAKDSHNIYFTDMYVVCMVELKNFLKKCNVANYCRKMKQLLTKIEESCKFLDTERSKRTFDLFDLADVELWENKIKESGTPVSKFYDSWIKVHQAQKLKLLTKNDENADPKLPTLKKKSKKRRDDSDEDSDLEVPVEEMERRLKKDKKLKKPKKKVKLTNDEDMEVDADHNDIVQDIKNGDWD